MRCAQYGVSRVSLRPGFSYFTSISTSAARHTFGRKVGHSDTRAEFIQQAHSRREFTSAGKPVDSSRAAKLFSSNYYLPPSNDVGHLACRDFENTFKGSARRYYERKGRGRIFLRREWRLINFSRVPRRHRLKYKHCEHRD